MEEIDLKKELRKAKIKNGVKTVVIVIVVLLILTPIAHKGSQRLAKKQSDQLNEFLFDIHTIGQPNVNIYSQVIENANVFGGQVVTRRAKDIDGYIAPSSEIRSPYSWTRHDISADSFSPGTHSDAENTYYFDKETKEKVMGFYSPHKKYPEGIPNELLDVSKMEHHVAEIAISFDKPYSYREVKKMMPKEVNTVWYWVNSKEYQENGSHLVGAEILGFSKEKGESAQDALDSFVDVVEKYDKGKSDSNPIPTDLVGQVKDKNVEDVLLSGVVITGQTKNFQSLANEQWIRASSVGSTVEIVPYIKPVK